MTIPTPETIEATAQARNVLKSHPALPPIEPIALAEEFGLTVYKTRRLAKGVSGALAKYKNNPNYYIFVNDADSYVRQRFTVAHELGHYLQLLEQGELPDSLSPFYRAELSSYGSDPYEIYANKFAAALLMPEEEVNRLVENGSNLINLVSYFRVSAEAVKYRLEGLGLSVSR